MKAERKKTASTEAFTIIREEDETFRVSIAYLELDTSQAESIQLILKKYLKYACYVPDSKTTKRHTGYITSLAFNELEMADRLVADLVTTLNTTSFEVTEAGSTHIHHGDSFIRTQVTGTNYDHPTLKDGSYQKEKSKQKEKQQIRTARTTDILTAGHWHLPLSNTAYYIERKAVSAAMRAHFNETTDSESTSTALASPTQTKTVVLSALYGLGGIGKTQIAIDYITQTEGYAFRCWFDVRNLDGDYRQFAFDLGLAHLDEKLDATEVRTRVCAWFDSHPGWLAVYDNAEALGDLKPYLPREGGDVLITSRNAVSPWHTLGRSIPVDLMTEEEAMALLEKQMGKADARSTDLAKELGYLPLALAQAGAYIRETGIDVATYLDWYAAEQASLLAENCLDKDDLTRDDAGNPKPHATVMTTWMMSFKAIEKAETVASQQAMRLLNVCAYLAPSIADRLLLAMLELKADVRGQMQLKKAKQHLRRYSLLECKEANTSSVHQLVQAVIRSRHHNAQQVWRWLDKAVEIIDQDYGTDRDSVADYQKVSLAPHLLSLKKRLEQYREQGKEREDEASLEQHERQVAQALSVILEHLGLTQGDLDHYTEQKRLLAAALAIQREVYGEHHPAVASTLNHLGNACGDLGEYAEKKRLLAAALAIQREAYGEHHPAVAITLNNLGNACGDLGEYAEQKRLLAAALAIKWEVYGEHHPAVARTLNNLGNACGALGEYAEQKRLLAAALAIQREVYGEHHPEVAMTLNNLGNACGALGEYAEQKRLQTAALAIKREVYGEHHPAVAMTLDNLGNACGDLGEYAEQKRLLAAALAIQREVYGEHHPAVARTLNNLGNACGALGEYAEQKRLAAAALAIFKDVYGEHHPEVAMTLNNLGNACGDLGEYAEKKRLLAAALAIQREVYGEHHPAVARTLNNSGNACGALGDYAEKKRLLAAALAIFKDVYGEHHPAVAITQVNLAAAYESLGKYAKAIAHYESALAVLLNHKSHYAPQVLDWLEDCQEKLACQQSPSNPSVAPVDVDYGLALALRLSLEEESQRLLREAERCFEANEIERAISHYEAYIDSAGDPSAAYHNLACCYHLQGDAVQADTMFQLAVVECTKASSLCEYGHFLFQQGRYKEAIQQLTLVSAHKADASRLVYCRSEAAVIESHLSEYIATYGELAIQPDRLADYLLLLCYQRLGDDLGVATTLGDLEDRLLSLESPRVLDYYLLGSLYDSLSDAEQSSDYFERAKQAAQKTVITESLTGVGIFASTPRHEESATGAMSECSITQGGSDFS